MNGLKKILITGSSGTIGTRLFETLLGAGCDVYGVDKVPHAWNNEELSKRTIMLDLRDKDQVLKKLPKDIDIIIHLAANARVHNLILNPVLARDNFEMIFNVYEFARLNCIKKCIFTSSREVYGNSENITHREDDVHLNFCESPYTASKIGGEALVHSYKHCYEIDSIVLRLSNVYGMYDTSDRLIPNFIRRCIDNTELVVYGEDKLLDITHIDDCIEGFIKILTRFDLIKNQTYNLAYGEGISIVSIAELIREKIGSESKIRIENSRSGEVTQYIANITKAKNTFEFRPKISAKNGIEKTIAWYLGNVHCNKS